MLIYIQNKCTLETTRKYKTNSSLFQFKMLPNFIVKCGMIVYLKGWLATLASMLQAWVRLRTTSESQNRKEVTLNAASLDATGLG